MLPKAEYLASLPRKRMIASALIRDSAGNVLCVNPTYKKTWHLPGGSVEAGESPSDACARECREELGTAATVGRLLAVGHLPPGSDDPHGAMAFVCDATIDGVPVATLTLPADELLEVAWLDGAERGKLLSPLAHRLVDAGLSAAKSGGVVEFDRLSRGTA